MSLQLERPMFKAAGNSKMGFLQGGSRPSCCFWSRLPVSPETRSSPRGFLRRYSRHLSACGERWLAGRVPEERQAGRQAEREVGDRRSEMERESA